MHSKVGFVPPAPVRTPFLSDGSRDLLSGMGAGFAVRFIDHPLDTVKVLQQTMGNQYTGPFDCLFKTYKAGGIRALYRGLPPPLLGSMAECATLFVSYGYMKKLMGVDEDNATLANPVPMWKLCVSGASTGVCSAFVLTPVELIKCRLQVQSGAASLGTRYSGPLDCIARILREEGVRGLWRGYGSCVVREMPGNFAWFGAYETVLRCIQVANGYERKSDVPLGWSALAGSFAGVSYWALPFPADTVKSKLQTDARYAGRPFLEVFRSVVREEGVQGLYRGLTITCLRAAPAHALLFYAYEVVSFYLKRF